MAGSTGTLRLSYECKKDSFISGTRTIIETDVGNSDFYQDVAITVSGNVGTVAAFPIDTTTDSTDATAKLTGILLDANGNWNGEYLFRNFRVPSSLGSSISYSDLVGYNLVPAPYSDPAVTGGYTVAQSDARFVHQTGAENIGGPKNFTVSPTVPDPTTALQAANLGTITKNIGNLALDFSGQSSCHVNHGYVHRDAQLYKEFIYMALVKPSGDVGPGYTYSGGYGGSHCLLVGFQSGFVTGNLTDSDIGGNISFVAQDSLRSNEWAWIAVVYQKGVITVLVNGIPSSTVTYTGNRKIASPTDGGGYVGGSDHNNYHGRIAAWALYEGTADLWTGTPAGSFIRPLVETLTRGEIVAANTDIVVPHLLADYRQGHTNDLSKGLPVGRSQQETVTAAGTVSGAGNGNIVVTHPGLNGGAAYTVTFAVANTDTPAVWAPKAVAALAADIRIANKFNTVGTGTTIGLQTKLPAPNEPTFNIAVNTGTATGITTVSTSTHAVTGWLEAVVKHHGERVGGSLYFGDTLDEPLASNRDPSLRPQWVIDPFVYSTTAATQQTPIANSRIYDSFGRADVHKGNSTVLTLGTTEVGNKTWTGTGFILNGWATGTGTVPDTVADATVILRRPSSAGRQGGYQVFGRINGADQLYVQTTAAGDIFIQQTVSGVTTTPFSAFGTWADAWLEMKLVVTGNQMQVYKDGSLYATVTTTVLSCDHRGFSVDTMSRVDEFAVI